MCFFDTYTGPCNSYEARWHYDSEDGDCKQFTYGGCQGNANNFKTSDDCYSACRGVQGISIINLHNAIK